MQPTFSDTIPLPNGFQPERNRCRESPRILCRVTSNGGDLRTGEGQILNPSIDDRIAVGLSYDQGSNNLFVAGGGTGKAFVYDAETGEPAATYSLADPGTFVNDVVVASDAAYLTDSFRSFLYKVPLGPAEALPDESEVEEISLGDDFEFVPGSFNANGIDAAPNGNYLIIVNSTTGRSSPRSSQGRARVRTGDLDGRAVPLTDSVDVGQLDAEFGSLRV